MERVSDERLKQLLYYFGDEVGVEIEDCLKELQQLRAALPKVRGALELCSEPITIVSDEYSTYTIHDSRHLSAQQALDILDSLEVK